MRDLELMVTLWPSLPHFARFRADRRLAGIRLNSAMMECAELESELKIADVGVSPTPLWFDVKGRQMRVAEVISDPRRLIITLNHAVSVATPTPVLFKAGADDALLESLEDGGRKLIFRGGPRYTVRRGESIHIRHPSLMVNGPIFTDEEKAKITMVKAAGFRRYFLSYVEAERDLDEFAELVGADAEVMIKIENKRGLAFVRDSFVKKPNHMLVAARGDLYVEVDRPHHILPALKLIIAKDPEAQVGSRMLLSVIHEEVPSCADWQDLAWLYDIGYRKMMLCDELCLKEELLARAVNAFASFRAEYPTPSVSQPQPMMRRTLCLRFGL